MSREAPASTEPASPGARLVSPLWERLIRFFLWLGVALCIALLPIHKGFNHDEHQHISAGALLARQGLLPYRDFPYFHTPYLVYIYGALFKLTDHLTLAARLFSALCAFLTIYLVVGMAERLYRDRSPLVRWGMPAAALGLILFNALFVFTVGRAWNQEPSVLFACTAIVLHLAALRSPRSRTFLFLSGLALATAIGLRITVAPLGLPFLVLLFFFPREKGTRLSLFASFAAGLAVASIPLLISFCLAPRQWLFCNFEFSHVNYVFRTAVGHSRTMTLGRKARYIVKSLLWSRTETNIPLALAVIGAAVLLWQERLQAGVRRSREALFFLLLAPFVLLGSLAPSPLFEQYFYICVPFTVLGLLYALSRCGDRQVGRGLLLLAGCAVLSLCLKFSAYRPWNDLFTPNGWSPVGVHDEGVALRKYLPAGKVLTLATTYPLEGGLSIYPPLSTGFAAWRVAPFIEPDLRRLLHLVGEDDLEQYLAADPPAGIMVGCEREGYEEPLLHYAETHGYHQVNDGACRLLLPPSAK